VRHVNRALLGISGIPFGDAVHESSWCMYVNVVYAVYVTDGAAGARVPERFAT